MPDTVMTHHTGIDQEEEVSRQVIGYLPYRAVEELLGPQTDSRDREIQTKMDAHIDGQEVLKRRILISQFKSFKPS